MHTTGLSLILIAICATTVMSDQILGGMKPVSIQYDSQWRVRARSNSDGREFRNAVRGQVVTDTEMPVDVMKNNELRVRACTAESLIFFIVQPLLEQRGDVEFNPTVARPAYPKHHPKVLFDEAHNNPDTSAGRYKPFADLITNDGYRVIPNRGVFSKQSLRGFEVVIVVNASGPSGQRDSSAFSTAECDAIQEWVRAGGSLLVITDHAPYSNAVADLVKRFDVEVTNGYTVDGSQHNPESDDETELLFVREGGLADHQITNGRDSTERINRVVTFTGTSLKGPSGSIAFLKLSNSAKDVLPPPQAAKPRVPGEAAPDHTTVSASGRAQGLALEFGKGRVVVLSEAAVLTAQVASRGLRFGMSSSGTDNRQLALNIMHWLTGLTR